MTAVNSPNLKTWYFFLITLAQSSTQKYLWYTKYMCWINLKSKHQTSRRQLYSKMTVKLLKLLQFWTSMCNMGYTSAFPKFWNIIKYLYKIQQLDQQRWNLISRVLTSTYIYIYNCQINAGKHDNTCMPGVWWEESKILNETTLSYLR